MLKSPSKPNPLKELDTLLMRVYPLSQGFPSSPRQNREGDESSHRRSRYPDLLFSVNNNFSRALQVLTDKDIHDHDV